MTGIVAFCIGVIAATRLPWLPPVNVLFLCVPLLIALQVAAPLRALGLLVAGIGYGVLHGHLALSTQLPPGLEGQDIPLRVCVTGLPTKRDGRFGPVSRFDALLVDAPAVAGARWDGRRLRLSWFDRVRLQPGDLVEATVRLKRPRGFVNPGGFDYQAVLLGQRIDATGYVRDRAGAKITKAAPLCRPGVDAMREHLRTTLQARVGDHPAFGMLKAITLGDGSDLSTADWQRFASTGTSHLMVISGLHISLVAALSGLLFNRLARCSAWLIARVPAMTIGWCAAVVPVVAYAALAGFSIATRRALLMLLVALLYRLAARKPAVWSAYALAALLVLLYDPLAPLSRGFWLSFAAVAGLILGMGGRLHERAWWHTIARAQLVAVVAMIVPLALAGLPQPLIAPLVNAVAVPWVSLLVVPAALFGLVLLAFGAVAELPLQLALWGLACLDDGLRWAVSFDAMPLPPVAGVPTMVVAGALIGVVLWLLPRGFPARRLALLLVLPLFLARPPTPEKGAVELWFLDVGQGTAILVRTAAHTMVYDAGPRFSDRFDAGSGIVAPALRELGIGEVDLLMLSHSDTDHTGGAAGLLQQVPVAQVVGGQPVPGLPMLGDCADMPDWRWDGVQFSLLHPNGERYSRDNNFSCVLKIETADASVLLTGDIEERVERQLLREQPEALRADLLLMPHHGSKTSSTSGFINAVEPRWVIATAAWRSRFGHPHPTVVARYADRQARVLNTATSGAIRFRIDADGVLSEPVGWRQQARRYWFD